jgi:hypothetical protein
MATPLPPEPLGAGVAHRRQSVFGALSVGPATVMPVWASILVSLATAACIAAATFVFKVTRKIEHYDTLQELHSKLLDCIPEMQKDIATMRQNDEVFWKVIGPHMSSVIQSPVHLDRDHLIRKLDEGSLTYQEALALSSALGHAFDDETDKGLKTAFAFKLAQVRCLLVSMDRERERAQEGMHECSQQTPQMPSSWWPHSRHL